MKISYLINQYPKVSHSFIRREILALARLGADIQRISIRGWRDSVVDAADIQEQTVTRFILQDGILRLLLSWMICLIHKPRQLGQAFVVMMQMYKTSDRSFLLHLVTLMEACRILPWLKQHQSEFIHAHFGTNSAEIALYASLLSGIPYSFTVHGPEEFDKPQALNLKLKTEYAAFVVCISHYGRSQLFRWIDYVTWHKIHIVHCGLEVDFFALEMAKQTPEIPQFVCIGRLCEQKGQLLLIEAAKQLKMRGYKFQLVLAGDGEMRSIIEQQIATANLTDNVTITGWIDSTEVKRWLLTSTAMVLPSFAEGLPVVIMEAMALQCPVVSTYVAGIPELVHTGKNGWLVSAGDASQLAEVLIEVIETSSQTRNKLGEQARMDVLANHLIDTEAKKLLDCFYNDRQV